MKIATFDAAAGVAGDMWVAALVDAGAPLVALQEAVAGLGIDGLALRCEAVQRGGLRGLRFCVDEPAGGEQPHRHLADLLELVGRASVSAQVSDRAAAVFTALAEAEARVHGIDVDRVHFHEVGALDALCDVLCACIGLELLGVERLFCSAVELGSGVVRCAHGTLPVPAPGTLGNLLGVPTVQRGLPGERTTPTGAALLRVLVDGYEQRPAMRPLAVGYGAGQRDDGPVANLLRITVGETVEESGSAQAVAEPLTELVCNLDTATGEQLAWLIDESLRRGARDAWVVGAQMKKGRPGSLLHALVDDQHRAAVEALWLEDGGTLGLRAHRVSRRVLERWTETRDTSLGAVRFKCARAPSGGLLARPEDDDVRRLCAEHALSRCEVLQRLGIGQA